MRYDYLIFDVDDTLLNFRAAYSSGQRAVAGYLGVDFSEEFIRIDEELSWKGWSEFGLDETGREDVQRNYHKYYAQYLERHFIGLCQAFGVSACAAELVSCYQNAVAASREMVEQTTLSVYSGLAGSFKNVIATNGIGWMQRARLQGFLPYTHDIFISEEMGVIKPARLFYDILLDRLGCSPERCLMIGDSLSNDIAGAKAAGIPSCWYNRKRRPLPEGTAVDFVIESIEELKAIL